MSEDKKNGVNNPPAKAHPEVRYMQAEQLAASVVNATEYQQLVDTFEKALQMGEQAGLRAAKSFFETRVAVLRNSFANGVANHVLQATNKFIEWVNGSDNFKLWKRPEVVKAAGDQPEEKKEEPPKEPGSDRKFFGQLQAVPPPVTAGEIVPPEEKKGE